MVVPSCLILTPGLTLSLTLSLTLGRRSSGVVVLEFGPWNMHKITP
jgi:hypothetical protein